MKEKGIIGGFTVEDANFKSAKIGVPKSQWNYFEKDLFFAGTVRILIIIF